MINVAAMFLLFAAQQEAATTTQTPMQFRLECKVMEVTNIKGPEITVSPIEPKVTFAATTKLVTSPMIRTLESMAASTSITDQNGNGEKLWLLPSRTKDGRFGLSVEISNTRNGITITQKVDVKMNASDWVQVISKSRKRVVTIKLEPAID